MFETNPYPHSVNTSLWTLPIEATMYASTLLVVPLLARAPRSVTALIVFLTLAACFVYVRHPYSLRPVSDVQLYGFRLYDGLGYIPNYLAGSLFAYWRLDRLSRPATAIVVAVSFSVLACLQLVPTDYALVFAIFPIVALSLLIGLSPLLHSQTLSRVGDISYGTFLWGFLVQQIVVWTLGPSLSPWLLALVSLPIAWALGLLSWRLIERPALRFKPSRSADRIQGEVLPPRAALQDQAGR